MFDVLKEKTGIYSTLGSFYTQVITDKDRVTGHRLSHIPFQTAVFKRFNSMENNLLGYQYSHRKHLNIVYSDKDLKYGTYSKVTKGIPKESEISILPDALQGNADKLTLDTNTFLAFVLKVPDDIYVRVIQYEDGSVLVDGVNFKSQYGKIIFTESPISLFKGMTFFVLSYTKRERNIMCYPLQLQDVYGDVSQVIQYYKNNQSLKQFKKALYQAIGIPVVKYKESIIDRIELPHGMSYVMASGIQYDANFPHTYLNIGVTLEKDYIIGGEEFLKVYLPTDTIPSDIKSVSIQNMSISGGKDLYVNNVEATLYSDNLFQPQNFVHGEGAQYYIDYVNSVGLLEKKVSSIPDSMNCIDFLRNVVAANRCLVIQIDEERIPYDIAMKLKSFIIDHAPIGSVIAYCNGKPTVDPPVDPPAPEPLPELIRLRTKIDMSAPEDRLKFLDDNTTLISSKNLNSSKGFTLMLTMNWTSVTDSPLIWFATDEVNHTYGNAMALLGYTKGFKHNSMYSALGNNLSTTDLYPITDSNKDNVPDYINSTSPRNDTSLAGKTLVYFIKIKNNEQTGNGQAVLYELMNDKTVQAIAECYNSQSNVLSRGTLGWITCSNWTSGSANAGFVTVDAYDGILTQEEMNRLANNISQ